MQEPLTSRKEGEWWTTIEELFHWDGDRKSPEKVRRYASSVDVVPDKLEEYRALHSSIGSGILENMRTAHISNYTVFMHNTRAYTYFEYAGGDFENDMARMTVETETCMWLDACRTLQYKIPGEKSADWWQEMREVFHTD
jgi:L-rhamnose mutarotase